MNMSKDFYLSQFKREENLIHSTLTGCLLGIMGIHEIEKNDAESIQEIQNLVSAYREIKKETPQLEGADKENTQLDSSTEWTYEQILRNEA